MTQISQSPRHEQRKVDELLLKLSKMKPVAAKPEIVLGKPAIRVAGTANPRVFFST